MQAKVICPRIRIPDTVWKRLMLYIKVCPMEVGGLGSVEWREGDLVVTDVFLLQQKVTSATTALDPAAVARFVTEWTAEGKDPEILRFWWHSHADMNVFWSGTDLETIRLLSEGNFLVALVGNHRLETRTRLTVSKPVPFALDDAPLIIEPDFSQEMIEAASGEVKAKVKMAGGLAGLRLRRRHAALTPLEEKFLLADTDDDSGKGGPS